LAVECVTIANGKPVEAVVAKPAKMIVPKPSHGIDDNSVEYHPQLRGDVAQ
jgi:hypothetical protein